MSNASVSSRGRLASVDALRGLTVAAMLLVNDPGDWGRVYGPLEHAEWNGCTPTDLIFPFFLFIVGVSIALAVGPRLERGDAREPLLRAALARALRIVLLGVAINLLAAWLLPGRDMRWPGVLQRIGVCFAVTAVLAIHTPRRAWWVVLVGLLAGYAALLHVGGMAEWDNWVDRVDGAVFGRYVWDHDAITGRVHDPEGLLGTLPAIASTLLGLVAGTWLRAGARRTLLLAGLVMLAAGGLGSALMPFNKNLWTPTFVLWTTGWAMLALLACHELVDRHGWPPLGRRFGVNAIAAYAGSELMQILLPASGLQPLLYERGFAGWLMPLAGPYVASLAWAIAFVAFWWVIVWAMDRRGVYLKL
ncbi:MAG: heparan-alpha-glucosaminide N-acetyltransferase domain-containing protein [Pseudomonadota bacterium]